MWENYSLCWCNQVTRSKISELRFELWLHLLRFSGPWEYVVLIRSAPAFLILYLFFMYKLIFSFVGPTIKSKPYISYIPEVIQHWTRFYIAWPEYFPLIRIIASMVYGLRPITISVSFVASMNICMLNLCKSNKAEVKWRIVCCCFKISSHFDISNLLLIFWLSTGAASYEPVTRYLKRLPRKSFTSTQTCAGIACGGKWMNHCDYMMLSALNSKSPINSQCYYILTFIKDTPLT